MPLDIKGFILHFLKAKDMCGPQVDFEPIAADGSQRRFWRVRPAVTGTSFIAMSNPPQDIYSRKENFAFARIGRHLYSKGLSVPEIYLHDLHNGFFIMEDMGQTNLQDMVSKSEHPLPIYENVLEGLFQLQTRGAQDFDTRWCCQTSTYDATVMRRYEADYFRDAFLGNYMGYKKDRAKLEGPFRYLCGKASKARGHFFMHRDFQSRNIMISEHKFAFIDWQGGRLGPLGYDLASLIIDPYVTLSVAQRYEIYQRYLRLIQGQPDQTIESFKRYFPYLAIQRNLQILGAFSYLTQAKGKTYFEAYIPKALTSLCHLLENINDPQLSFLKCLVNDLHTKEKPVDMTDPEE